MLIVGAGPVGASLACALEGQGLTVALVDRYEINSDRAARTDVRGIALSVASKNILEMLGVWQPIKEADISEIRSIHVSQKGRFGQVRLAAERVDEALGWVIGSSVLNNAIAGSVSMLNDTSIFAPARVIAIDQDKAKMKLKIEWSGKKVSIHAKILVGADGVHSVVRQYLSIQQTTENYQQTAIAANIMLERPHSNVAFERFTDSGTVAMLPLAPKTYALIWSLPNGLLREFQAYTDSQFLQRLTEDFGERLGPFASMGSRDVFPLNRVVSQHTVGEQCVLIGNAAHTMHPLAGQGFNLGLRDMAVLAELLVDAKRHTKPINSPDLLGCYAENRRVDQRAIVSGTDFLVAMFSSKLIGLKTVRGLGLAAFNLMPYAKQELVRYASGFGGVVPRLAFGQQL